MSGRPAPPARFSVDALGGLDEPVRRYFAHAIAEGAPLARRVRLEMRGRIKVGPWLAFDATEECDVRSFVWRARAGLGPARPLRVVDRFADGGGSTEGRLLGRRVFHADGPDVARSAAARAGAEGLVFAPAGALPGGGVDWEAEGDDAIAASWTVPPERVRVRLGLEADGRVRKLSLPRWGNVGQADYGYIPFGVTFDEERSFGDHRVPSRMAAGWWFGTPRYEPFFEAEIVALEPLLDR